MRAYKISAVGDGKPLGFGGSQAHAREVRDQVMARKELRKKDLQIEEVEVPTGKTDLLEFINGLLGDE